jgi:hypothetical protein
VRVEEHFRHEFERIRDATCKEANQARQRERMDLAWRSVRISSCAEFQPLLGIDARPNVLGVYPHRWFETRRIRMRCSRRRSEV